jgi:alanyl-tRNA synthetase
MLSEAAQVGAVKVLTVKVPGADAGKLRQMGDVLRDKDESVVAVLASVNGEKVTFLAVCGKLAVKAGVKAGEIVKHVCTVCGGSGGGKPDSAMGGGKDASKMDDALNSVVEFVSSKLK